MAEALSLRTDLAAAVAGGSEKPEVALTRLQEQRAASGLDLDRDADFALAAIDVGQRLIALHKPAEAEKFFRSAEEALSGLVQRTADSEARAKAMYLDKLALIRHNFLGKREQARADLEAAIKLQPEDKYLLGKRATMPEEKTPAGVAKSNG